MSLIAVVDYGMGNLRSVDKALEHVAMSGQEVRITSSAEDIASADRVVFPGQGAARDCMHELKQRNLIGPVMQAAKEKPFLGICMGLQVLMSHSEENHGVDCMDMYKGEVRFFGNAINRDASTEQLKIPHMGWNNVTQTISHPLWHGIKQGSRFYFVHSYYVDPEDEAIVAGETAYDIVFTSAVACGNVLQYSFILRKVQQTVCSC